MIVQDNIGKEIFNELIPTDERCVSCGGGLNRDPLRPGVWLHKVPHLSLPCMGAAKPMPHNVLYIWKEHPK